MKTEEQTSHQLVRVDLEVRNWLTDEIEERVFIVTQKHQEDLLEKVANTFSDKDIISLEHTKLMEYVEVWIPADLIQTNGAMIDDREL